VTYLQDRKLLSKSQDLLHGSGYQFLASDGQRGSNPVVPEKYGGLNRSMQHHLI
jgi:hypothetical protein